MEEEKKKTEELEERLKELAQLEEEAFNRLSQTQALHKTQNKTAPGISGIGYILLKKVSPKTTKILVRFVNSILEYGKIPEKWKLGQLYLIPKGSFWEYNLSHTRPIALLETCRKVLTRIIQARLDQVLGENNVLKDANFAGLLEESTAAPIHIMNNIIKEATEECKKLWVLYQNMKKAFDL